MNFDFKKIAFWQRVSATQKMFLIQQMQIMVRSGVPLTKALDAIRAQSANKYLKIILNEIENSINKGRSLADAMRPFESDFGELMINMIQAGETSGRLDEVLGQIYIQAKKDHEIVSRVRGALIYPAIVIIAMIGIATFMVTSIIPKLTSLFEESGIALPLPTRILIGTSDFVVNNGIVTFLIVVSIIVGFTVAIRLPAGRSIWHSFLLRMPVIGPIVHKVNLARFSRTVSSFLKTDIPIVETLVVTSRVLGNVHYSQALVDASKQIAKGITMEKALAPHPQLFNPTILQMISVGEQSGSLDDMLVEAANFYESEVNQIMETLPTILEPLLIIILGLGVGAMAVAIIQPLYSLTEAI